jgi:hypothetical protein
MSNAQQQQAATARPPPARADYVATSSTAAANTSSEALTTDAATDSSIIHLNPRTSTTRVSSSSRSQPAEEDEVRCWICFASDWDEDKPRGDWRAPCKCSLVAHEACLLDWIADMQKSEGGGTKKPACPQCKTLIRLKEEQSLVLDTVDKATSMVGKAGAFVAFGGMTSWLLLSSSSYV